MTDAELVALARQGDRQAFGELVTRHQAAVYRAAMAAVGSPAEAEDAAQDAFVSAYRRLGSFRGDATFKTWLLTIAWNHAINRRRRLRGWISRFTGQQEGPGGHAEPRNRFLSAARHQRQNVVGVGPQRQWEKVDGLSPQDVPIDAPSPEQLAIDAQLRREIAAEIRALSPKLRDALLLARSGEYGYGEIVRVTVGLEYSLPALAEEPAAGPRLVRTGIQENLSVNLDDGKPLVVAQSADPVSDRQVTVEVRATILK